MRFGGIRQTFEAVAAFQHREEISLTEFTLDPGESLIIYSDGVSEALDAQALNMAQTGCAASSASTKAQNLRIC